MKSRISSCNRALFRKDLTRFAPVWGGYLLCLAVVFVLFGANSDRDYWFASDMAACLGVTPVVTCGYALLTAQLLFGDLYNSRLCHAIHALPLRRESLFRIHVAAGIWMHLVPTALTALGALPTLMGSIIPNAWQISLMWLVVINLQYLFFFCLAVFCTMCVGTRFAMAVVYGILNLGSTLLYLMLETLYIPRMMGVMTEPGLLQQFSPVVEMTTHVYGFTERHQMYPNSPDAQQRKLYEGSFHISQEGWLYLAAAVAVGLVLLLIAWQMYRKRHLERAGDFMAVRAMEPVAMVLISLCGAACGQAGLVILGFGDDHVFLAFLGLAVGWFVARMLIERSTRVFRPKNWIGLVALALVMMTTMWMTQQDMFGIESYIPQPEQIKKVTMDLSYNSQVVLETEQEIADARWIHGKALEERVEEQLHPDAVNANSYNFDESSETANPSSYLYLVYELNNGQTVKRRYHFYVNSEIGELVKQYMSTVEGVFRTNARGTLDTPEKLLARAEQDPSMFSVDSIAVPETLMTKEALAGLYQAVIADCEEGHMVQNSMFHPNTPVVNKQDYIWVMIQYEDPTMLDRFDYIQFEVYSDAAHTLAWLEESGMMDTVRDFSQYYGG